MKRPFFSVVLVNFNGAKYLRQAINSILNQVGTEHELIVIDGASKDDSVEIIKEFSSHLAYWVSEPDSGQSEAFNKGFRRATGEYFLWINSDDVLLPGALYAAAHHITQNPAFHWYAANTIFFGSDGHVTRCARGVKWHSFAFAGYPINVGGPTSIFHHTLLRDAGGFDESLHFAMDTDLWLRFAAMGYKFSRIPRYIWGFRVHDESKTSHSFWGAPSAPFQKEQAELRRRYKLTGSRSAPVAQRVGKVISGAYLRSWIDTRRLKGLRIEALSGDILA